MKSAEEMPSEQRPSREQPHRGRHRTKTDPRNTRGVFCFLRLTKASRNPRHGIHWAESTNGIKLSRGLGQLSLRAISLSDVLEAPNKFRSCDGRPPTLPTSPLLAHCSVRHSLQGSDPKTRGDLWSVLKFLLRRSMDDGFNLLPQVSGWRLAAKNRKTHPFVELSCFCLLASLVGFKGNRCHRWK